MSTEWISQKDVAARYPVSEGTLFNLRKAGDGPAWSRLGQRVVYRVSDIENYLESRMGAEYDPDRDQH